MKFLFVQAMRLTEKLQQNSPQQDFWKKQNRFWKCFRDGNAISAESENMKNLPENCRKYIEFVEKQIGFPITMVSNGPGRNDIIYRK